MLACSNGTLALNQVLISVSRYREMTQTHEALAREVIFAEFSGVRSGFTVRANVHVHMCVGLSVHACGTCFLPACSPACAAERFAVRPAAQQHAAA
jgi:hypothetical protein